MNKFDRWLFTVSDDTKYNVISHDYKISTAL